jgi:hypothetical protein
MCLLAALEICPPLWFPQLTGIQFARAYIKYQKIGSRKRSLEIKLLDIPKA